METVLLMLCLNLEGVVMVSSANNPFFSVVIPVYNSEKYLNECIESVFAQTCTDYELILVDDESTDRSVQICDEWKRKYPEKIQVIHQKNTGVYIAKRNGINASHGKYLYVMDNDDLIVSKTAFETIRDRICEYECDLIIFNATDNIETGHLLCNIPFADKELFEGEKLQVIYDEYLKSKNLHHIWMMVFKRELFDGDFEYTENYRMLRDGPLLILPILSRASRVMYLQDTFYYWRVQNQNSASKHYDVVNFYNSIRFLHRSVINYSKGWKYKSEFTDSLIKANYITDICIAAVKVRSMPPKSPVSKKQYLKMLSEDEMFREDFSLNHLEAYRKVIAWALYHHQYWMINTISSLVGVIKRR